MIHVFSCSFHCVCFVEKKNGRTQMTNIVFFFIVRLGYRSYSLGMDNEICVNRISAIPLCDYHRAHGKWTTTEYSCYFLIHIVDVNVIGMTKFSRKIQSCWCKTTKSICKKRMIFIPFLQSSSELPFLHAIDQFILCVCCQFEWQFELMSKLIQLIFWLFRKYFCNITNDDTSWFHSGYYFKTLLVFKEDFHLKHFLATEATL